MTSSSGLQGVAVALIVIVVLSLLASIGCYLWYAIALSKLFPKIGGESWKGWVPILNEAEILARGGVPAWSVIYYFIPVVQLYGLYLKAVALLRINSKFGRGAGLTVVGILFPPIWASILGWGQEPDDGEFTRRVASITPPRPDRVAGPLAPPSATFGATVTDASGYAIPANAPQSPAQSAPPAPPQAPSGPLSAMMASPVAAPVDASEQEPVRSPGFIENPWASPVQPPSAAAKEQVPPAAESARPIMDFPRIVPLPAGSAVPALVAPPVTLPPAPASFAPEATVSPVAPVIPELPVIPSVSSTPQDVVAEPEPEEDDDLDETVVVDRRPRVTWSLELDDGRVFPLTATRVELGRKPSSDDSAAQLLAIEDSTRTLSKTHARLILDDGQWTITDLNSTNGVIVLDDGEETLLEPTASAVVLDRFVLGKVGMRVSFEKPSQK
ncbi:MAG: DUF5684 domain-containing protein [Lacisediminihabitans sp.]